MSAEFASPLDTVKRNLEEYRCLLWDITWCIHAYLIHHMNENKPYLIQI